MTDADHDRHDRHHGPGHHHRDDADHRLARTVTTVKATASVTATVRPSRRAASAGNGSADGARSATADGRSTTAKRATARSPTAREHYPDGLHPDGHDDRPFRRPDPSPALGPHERSPTSGHPVGDGRPDEDDDAPHTPQGRAYSSRPSSHRPAVAYAGSCGAAPSVGSTPGDAC